MQGDHILNPDFTASDLKVIVFKWVSCFPMAPQRATLLKMILYSMFQMETNGNVKENIFSCNFLVAENKVDTVHGIPHHSSIDDQAFKMVAYSHKGCWIVLKVKLHRCMCKFMSYFNGILSRLQLLSSNPTAPIWIYFLSMLLPSFHLSVRSFLIHPQHSTTHQDGPDGRHFKQANVCCGCLNTSRGRRGGWRWLPTVFNLAAMPLAFREDDKINKPTQCCVTLPKYTV